MADSKLLVTGASGQLGQRVVHHLLDTLGHDPAAVTLVSRNVDGLAAFAERGVTLRRGDFDDRGSLVDAFSGAERLLLVSTNAVGRRLEQHQTALSAADEVGVDHVVYTSMPDPYTSQVSFAPEHAGTEDLVRRRAGQWTILRNHWYFENLFLTLPNLKQSRKWFTAAGAARNADVSRDDLALAAATALVRATGGRTHTLSGPEAFSVADVAARLSPVLGVDLEVVPVSDEALVAGMQSAGMPPAMAEMFASFDTNTRAGHMGTVTSELEALIGRPAQRFDDWLVEHAEDLRAI